jgi:hypothetical protein
MIGRTCVRGHKMATGADWDVRELRGYTLDVARDEQEARKSALREIFVLQYSQGWSHVVAARSCHVGAHRRPFQASSVEVKNALVALESESSSY